MKKKTIILLVILAVLFLGAYLAFNEIFPRANAIDIQNVSSIKLTTGEEKDNKISLPQDDWDKLIPILNNSVPTRSMSVNDYPTVKPYYIIEVTSDGKNVRCYVYEEKGTAYLETPYEGIYRVDRQIISIIRKVMAILTIAI